MKFLGNLKESKKTIDVAITTASKGRIFLAKENLWATTDAGEIDSLVYQKNDRSVTLHLSTQHQNNTPNTLLVINPESNYEIKVCKKISWVDIRFQILQRGSR